ncbi:cysteine proteinase [Coniophora puteana RWD-64-598 SS2]|uniref:ubiquitinyl hydrolase 1 n=1 Tax=Coniophora puteana (strain RWD-64-598) TaxID=741705 RepID=A0A5M3MSZ4_CONPW|nr:cysteine proteinase [Coniophora puteana RWD-64-598 SS2]EIW82289.1 cysteine proteinase [Coniophora puteana RWD-64-598 SS2]
MTCNLRQVMQESHSKRHAFTPYLVTSKLQLIAKSMRRGRQEDAHEFLRYAVDALQRSCLSGYPPKMDHKLAETTWVHKLFGGRLRSRVTCRDCGYNSDTYDRILDLSLDIYGSNSLREALRKFVTVEYLKGQDKYKCEKCKKPVVAEKKFNVHEAPVVLTIHLKRFSPLGRKIGHFIHYDEHLALQPAMSEGSFGPSYTLYGVICHAGGGPNSGHYYAYIKSANGQWYEMNDDMVAPSKVAVGVKNAYILFYMRDKGQSLEAAITRPMPVAKINVIAGMKKRKAMDDDEDVGTKASRPFIGPLLPSPVLTGSEPKRPKPSPPDLQAATVKKKIDAAKASTALSALSQYDDEDDDANGGSGIKAPTSASMEQDTDCGTRDNAYFTASKDQSARSTPPATPPPSDTASSSTIPTSSFYASTSELPEKEASLHTRHSTPASDNERRPAKHFARQPLSPKHFSKHKRKSFSTNPFKAIGSNNLYSSDTRHSGSKVMQHYGKRPKMLI